MNSECRNCYGKGYSTVIQRVAGGHGQHAINKELERFRPCKYCDRGKEIGEAMDRAYSRGYDAGRKKGRDEAVDYMQANWDNYFDHETARPYQKLWEGARRG
jgi:hypothetical protein